MQVVFDSEEEMEDLIYQQYQESGTLIIDGTQPDILLRQFNLGVYGIADLIAVTVELDKGSDIRFVDYVVYELKKSTVGVGALMQAGRYSSGFERLLREKSEYAYCSGRIALVGTGIDDCCYLANNDYIDFNFYQATFDQHSGLSFSDYSGGGWYKPDFDFDKAYTAELSDYLSRAENKRQPKLVGV